MIASSSTPAILIIFFAWVVFTIWCVSRSAGKRGRDPFNWGVLAFFIGWFAYIPLWIMGTTEDERIRLVEADEQARLRVRGGTQ